METHLEIRDQQFAIGVPFTKINADKRTVEGFATLDNIDKTSEIVDFKASQDAFQKWLGNIREMHGPKAVGTALKVEEKDLNIDGQTHKGMWVEAYISKGAEDTWNKILDGTLKGFSIGGKVLEKRPEFLKSEGDRFSARQAYRITKYMLGELSVVDNPANPLALFTDHADKGYLIKFENGELTPTDILVEEYKVLYCTNCDCASLEKTTDAPCGTCSGSMLEIGEAYEVPTTEEVSDMAKEALSQLSDLEKTITVQDGKYCVQSKTGGRSFGCYPSMAEAKKRLAQVESFGKLEKALRSQDSVNYGPAELGEADACSNCAYFIAKDAGGTCQLVEGGISANYTCDLFEDKKVYDVTTTPIKPLQGPNATLKYENVIGEDELMKREFNTAARRRLAAAGAAMPDGSYPIVNRQDLSNAIQAIGRAKNPDATRRHIISRARALGLTNMLPKDWTKSEEGPDNLQKNDNDDNKVNKLLNNFIEAITERIKKSESVTERLEGGDLEEVDKESLSRILDVLKGAVGDVEGILEKVGVTRLNSEDSKEVDHVETVSLADGESADNGAPGKVATSGTGSKQETWAAPPGEANVLPHMGKSEDSEESKDETSEETATESLDVVKSVLTEELAKISSNIEETRKSFEDKFTEMTDRLDRVEKSGAGKKSGEVTELKKADETASFWGGAFKPF